MWTPRASLYGDALWASGRFDEPDGAYQRAPQRRRIATRPVRARADAGDVQQAGRSARLGAAASAASPRDGEIHALLGELTSGCIATTRRRPRCAAISTCCRTRIAATRPPGRERRWSSSTRSRASAPVEIDAEDRAVLHTLPFRLVNDKVVVRARINGSNAQDFVLDTGSEETIISADYGAAPPSGR